MNILIKLTCLIGLVIAPILGNGNVSHETGHQMMEMKCSHHASQMMGHCDMSKCATMTKEECAKMCDSLKCTPEQKEACLSHYDANGKFVPSSGSAKKSCCAHKK